MEEEFKMRNEELPSYKKELEESREKYTVVTEETNVGIWFLDLNTNKIFVSEVIYLMLGYAKNEFNEIADWYKIINGDDLKKISSIIKRNIEQKIESYECEVRVKTKKDEEMCLLLKGKVLFDKEGKPYKIAGYYTDISEIKQYQQKLQHFAYHDSLTNLPNRLHLYNYIDQSIKQSIDKGIIGGLLFIDIDNFKFVNDTLGHFLGDKLIIEISKRLGNFENSKSKLLRLGGDELVFYISEAKSEKEIEEFAKKVIHSFKEPFNLDDNILHITMSMGIAIFPKDGNDINSLLKSADIAMYKAKEYGKNGYVLFDSSINNDLTDKMKIEKHLRKALKNNEFTLHYQPQVDINNGQVSGFEALVRWVSPEIGMVPPNKFISVAEEMGLIVDLGEWILNSACNFIKKLHSKGYDNYTVSVNISIIQLIQNNFIDIIFKALEETGVPPEYLELEITESILMESLDLMREKLQLLKEKGIKIALDDFGKGYSSLTYLKQLPITTLKIDKSFIDDIQNSEISNIIVNSVIMIGHKINLVIVAEGVETEEQLKYLVKNACNRIQGYLFSKPIEEEKIMELLEKDIKLKKHI